MILPKKKFYIFKAGQELPYWLSAYISTAESKAKERELSFKNRSAKITFLASCTVSIRPPYAIINPIKGCNLNQCVIGISNLDSVLIFGIDGLTLTPNINPHKGKSITFKSEHGKSKIL